MPLALNAIYVAGLFLFSPLLIYRWARTGKYREGWREKLWGKAPLRIGHQPCLWFHAVSVGEVLLLRPLIREMSRRRPGWEIVISTTTSTGLAIARRTYPDLVTFYAPLDFSWSTRRAVERIRPTVLALVELELWPNLIRTAKRSGAKVAIINARLSARSYRGYRRLRLLLQSTLAQIDAVSAQNDEYAGRFVELGIPEERVRITGSVKFDGLEGDRNNARTRELRRLLALSPTDLVFVAGSTMEGEEEAAVSAYNAARRRHPSLRLVLVPRHAERFDEVAAWLVRQGETVVRRCQLGEGGAPHGPRLSRSNGRPPVILIDTIGELGAVWGLADVAFVGGSLLPGRGGQNMMEPAAYGASVMFGPHTSNFRDVVEQLLRHDAARRVRRRRGPGPRPAGRPRGPRVRRARGAAGRRLVLAQHGAAARTLHELDRLVESNAAA